MAKETEDQDFTIDIGGDALATITPNVGGGFKRVPWGDYKVRITAAKPKAKTGENPHVMCVVDFVIVEAKDPKNDHAVGMGMDGLYAGSAKSPKYMQQRLAALVQALQIKLAGGQQIQPGKHFVGRELDATVTWELSPPKFDATTGEQKRYVNSRLIGERPVGIARDKGVNPEQDSREAIKYLSDKYGDTEDAPAAAPAATAAPWAQETQAAAPEVEDAPASAPAGFREEGQADASVHQYRAYVKLKTPHAEAARQALVASGFDPDGPVNPENLPEPLKGQYVAAFPSQANGSLPPLPGLPGLPPAGGSKKGQRAPKSA